MDTQHREFRIGITVFVALIFLVILIVFFGKGTTMNFGDEYSIRVRFQRTPGINRNSPVFKNGVQIGRVQKVELVDMDREVEITILLSKKRKIYTNEQCRIRQTVIMGDASLEFARIPNFTGPVREIDPDEPQVGGAPADLMSGFSNIEGDLTQAIKDVSGAANQFNAVTVQVGQFVDKVNTIVGTPEDLQARMIRLETIVNESQLTMKSIREFSEGANAFFNDPVLQQNVRKVVEAMPDLLARSQTLVDDTGRFVTEARNLMTRGGTTLDKVDASLDKIGPSLDKAAAALESVKKVTDSIEDDVPELMASLKQSAKKLDSFFEEITGLIQSIRNADGTIMRLIHDPEAHDKLLVLLDNIEQVTGEVNRMIRTDFKPIANNVKILTDKAARDPAVFIRNLIRKQPPVKGGMPVWGDGLGSDTLGDLSCGLETFRRDSILYEFDSPDAVIEGPIETIPAAPTLAPETETPERIGFGAKISSLLPFSRHRPSAAVPETVEPQEPIPLGETIRFDEPAPEDGRIVHVDPRYATADGVSTWQQPVYRQMSYTEDETPRLKFSR